MNINNKKSIGGGNTTVQPRIVSYNMYADDCRSSLRSKFRTY